MSENCAVPLCLPNNCKWDEQTGEYSRDEDQERTSLWVIDTALERLRNVQGKFINICRFSQEISFMQRTCNYQKMNVNIYHLLGSTRF